MNIRCFGVLKLEIKSLQISNCDAKPCCMFRKFLDPVCLFFSSEKCWEKFIKWIFIEFKLSITCHVQDIAI